MLISITDASMDFICFRANPHTRPQFREEENRMYRAFMQCPVMSAIPAQGKLLKQNRQDKADNGTDPHQDEILAAITCTQDTEGLRDSSHSFVNIGPMGRLCDKA